MHTRDSTAPVFYLCWGGDAASWWELMTYEIGHWLTGANGEGECSGNNEFWWRKKPFSQVGSPQEGSVCSCEGVIKVTEVLEVPAGWLSYRRLCIAAGVKPRRRPHGCKPQGLGVELLKPMDPLSRCPVLWAYFFFFLFLHLQYYFIWDWISCDQADLELDMQRGMT